MAGADGSTSKFSHAIDNVLASLSDRTKHFDELLTSLEPKPVVKPKPTRKVGNSVPLATIPEAPEPVPTALDPDEVARRAAIAAKQKAKMAELSRRKAPVLSADVSIAAVADGESLTARSDGDGTRTTSLNTDLAALLPVSKPTVVSRETLSRLSKPAAKKPVEPAEPVVEPPAPLSPRTLHRIAERNREAIARLSQPRVKPVDAPVLKGDGDVSGSPPRATVDDPTAVYSAPLVLRSDSKVILIRSNAKGNRRKGKRAAKAERKRKPSVDSLVLSPDSRPAGSDWGSPIPPHTTTASGLASSPHQTTATAKATSPVDFCLFCGSEDVCGCEDSSCDDVEEL